MTVRQKISLLITAAGLLSSLVFSGIVLWEMLEQPFRLIDSDLETASRRAVLAAVDSGQPNKSAGRFFGDERYWLEIKDQASGKTIYRSELAKLIKLPRPASSPGSTIHLIVTRGTLGPGQDQSGETAFRVREARISIGPRDFIVRAGRPIENLEEELRDTLIGVGGGLVVSVLFLIGISYFLAGFILKPVRAINDQAQEISEKHLDRRMPVSGGRDEFNALAQTLNKVFDRLEHAFQRQKQLLADASHELKTPLTMIRLGLDELRSAGGRAKPDSAAKNLERMTEQVFRMERLIKNLLDLSALEIESAATKNPVNLTGILGSLIADYQLLAEPRGVTINVNPMRQLMAPGDAEKLTRAFSNILDNAVKYNQEGGTVAVAAEQSDAEVIITVSNTGPGVPKEELSKVFDQFYRVEQSRSIRHGGTGLGLSLVKRIIELHGGRVDFQSRAGELTWVTVRLPMA